MESERFDGWARGFAASLSRRRVSGIIAGAVAVAATAGSEAKKHKKKKKKHKPSKQTCPGGCPEWKFCFIDGCVCNGGLTVCGDNCCFPEEEACLEDGTCCSRQSSAQLCAGKTGIQINNCGEEIDCDEVNGGL